MAASGPEGAAITINKPTDAESIAASVAARTTSRTRNAATRV
jgi:hypothetical protein